ncbi:MAG: phage tail tube protein [Synergistaceae bacterium]
MAIGDIRAGYMGYANIAGANAIRFSDANLAVRQEVNAPDLVMGNFNRMAYVYGPAQVDGSISGPVTENFAAGGTSSVWGWATTRDACGLLTANTVDLYYFCGSATGSEAARSFGEMYVNSVTFSCSAGDIAQFSIDVLGAGDPTPPAWIPGSSGVSGAAEEKLLTWDGIDLTVSGPNAPTSTVYSNFEFTLSNNLEPVYAMHSTANYYPFDVVPGLRTISGSLSAYNVPSGTDGAYGYDDPLNAASSRGTVSFSIGALTIECYVKFHRVEPTASVGPIVSTIAFTGVGEQSF